MRKFAIVYIIDFVEFESWELQLNLFFSLDTVFFQKMPTTLLAVFALSTVLGYSVGYQLGAPGSTCLTMFPKHHGANRQTVPSPFTISTNQSSYFPGDYIEVTLRSSVPQRTFTGLQIRVHPGDGDREQIIGEFVEWPANKTKTMDCLGKKRNMVTHANGIPVSEVILTWQAPNISSGLIVFVVTFVEDFDHFWINQEVYLTAEVDVTIPPVQEVKSSVDVIDWSQCGKEKGCFLYPQTCTGYNCYAALTYKTSGELVQFEMFGSQPGYISVGFSDDKKMGDDETVSCTSGNLVDTGLQRGYNHIGLYNERQLKAGLIDLQSQYVDGRLYCRFIRPIEMSIFVRQGPVPLRSFDLHNEHYLMLAWGHIYDGSDVMGIHKELPPVTFNKVNFSENTIVRGSSLPLSYQIHGILMLIAWMLLVGIVTVIARYFKTGFGDKKFNDVKVWFQIHRAAAIGVWLLTVASFVLIFVVMEGLAKKVHAHHALGIAVMAASTLQVLAGLLRPGLTSKFRKAFNIGHWLMGKMTHILAGITFYFAFEQDLVPKPQRHFANIVLAVWLGQQLLWEGWFEVNQRCIKKDHFDTYKMAPIDKGTEKKTEGHPDSGMTADSTAPIETKWLLLYIASLLAIMTAALCSILLF